MNTRKIIAGFAISLIFTYLIIWKPQLAGLLSGRRELVDALFSTPRIDFGRIWFHMRNASMPLILAALLITPLHVLVRSHRWILLIRPLARLKLLDSFSLQMLGYMANTVLPMRIGEVIRGVLLGRKVRLSTSTALATVVLERLLDLAGLTVLVAVLALTYPLPEALHDAAVILVVGMAAGIAAVTYAAYSGSHLNGYLQSFVRFLPSALGSRIMSIVRKFIDGFKVIRSSHDAPAIIAESLLLWLLYAAQVFMMLTAFSLQQDFPQIADSPLIATWMTLAISAVVLSIPSAPGGLGTFHAAVVFALGIFGVDNESATGYAIVLHAISVFFYIAVGLVFLYREELKLFELGRMGHRASNDVDC